MTTEGRHNFNADNEYIEIVTDFVYLGSIINPNGDYSQETRRSLRLRRAAEKKLENIQYKDVSLESKAKIIFTIGLNSI